MTQFVNMEIEFNPCEGFGSYGRSATIWHIGFESWGFGVGGTDEEAVLEAMLDAGVSFEVACDECDALIKSASKITRNEVTA
jgi:hypothetical protein